MVKNKWSAFALAATTLLGGCAIKPEFNSAVPLSSTKVPDITISDVVQHVECEIRAAQESGYSTEEIALLESPDHDKTKQVRRDPIKDLIYKFNRDKYVAYATLTLDVSNSQNMAPNLSFIHPYLGGSQLNQTHAIGGQWTDTQHRNITQSFTLDLAGITDKTAPTPQCDGTEKTPEKSYGIKGDLGLFEIILSGVQRLEAEDFIYPRVKDEYAEISHSSSSLVPVFGTTIDFTLTYGVNGGPSWNLVHFKESGGSNGLFNLSRTKKDTLTISFAPAALAHKKPSLYNMLLLNRFELTQPKNQTEQQQLTDFRAEQQIEDDAFSKSNAARAAQDNNVRMLLQNLLPGGIQ